MPKAGMSMETGTIIQWLKNEGDTVVRGEPLLEIETDKLAMEIEAEDEGVLLKRLYENGDVVPVVTTIAWIGQTGETIPETADSPSIPGETPSHSHPGVRIPATPAAKRLAADRGLNLRDIIPTGRAGEITRSDVEKGLRTVPATVRSTPLAQRIARTEGIPLGGISGTGPGGKIYSCDLSKHSVETKTTSVPRPFTPPNRKRSEVAEQPLQGMRKIIADRMMETHRTVPPATLRIEIDADPMFHFRTEFNQVYEAKLTFNDLVLKATALALNESPELNAFLHGDKVSYNDRINLGVAMATERGLLVPVVADADTLPLHEISARVKDLGARAKSNRLKPDELAGGTFTVTNLGMYDIVSFTPIINLPQVAILGVCAIVETPVVRNGNIVPGRRMGICLTHDHRLIDGATGALFLQRIKQLLEKPLSLL